MFNNQFTLESNTLTDLYHIYLLMYLHYISCGSLNISLDEECIRIRIELIE